MFLLFLIPCFYCCEWLFHFLLCKAFWITTVYEMCYINKLALPCLAYFEVPNRIQGHVCTNVEIWKKVQYKVWLSRRSRESVCWRGTIFGTSLCMMRKQGNMSKLNTCLKCSDYSPCRNVHWRPITKLDVLFIVSTVTTAIETKICHDFIDMGNKTVCNSL